MGLRILASLGNGGLSRKGYKIWYLHTLMWNKINNDEQISLIRIRTITLPTCAMHTSKERGKQEMQHGRHLWPEH